MLMPACGQTSTDTLKLTIKQAEAMFLQNNLQLMAQHYNIDIASAQVITAKLLPNPDFSLSNGIAGSDRRRTGKRPVFRPDKNIEIRA